MAGTPGVPLLELRGITKRFGSVYANRGVDLTLEAGEILGLLGENGAGKTTLMNVAFGLYAPDAGAMRILGAPVTIRSPADALANGIGMVHQHFHLVPRHTVLENLLVGQPARRGMLDVAGARARLADIGRRFGLHLDPARRVGTLSVGEQQRVEIARALFRGARILILDEPTSVLTPQETDDLFVALRALAEHGVGIIFITHKLQEVRAITHRIAVMRQGEMTASLANDTALDNRHLAELMCGREITQPTREPTSPGRVLLRLVQIETRLAPEQAVALGGVSLEVRAGEILGVAGVSGNGQRQLAEVMGGLLQPTRGWLEVGGERIEHPDPRDLRRRGVVYIPEDRIGCGLLGALPLSDSMSLPRIGERPFSRFGVIDGHAVRRFVREQMARFGIRAVSPDARTGTLSGGNLQKVLLARELAFDPLVVVAAQPTRGLDLGARQFVHERFLDLRRRGRAVVLISEDLDEIGALSDRVAVMYEGRINAMLAADQAERARLGLLMAGMVEAA